MQVIDDLLAFQCCIRNRFSIVVNAGSVDAVEVGGYADRNFRFLSRRMEVSDKIYSRSQFQASPQTFFQPVHLHGELADLLCVSSFLFALLGELFFQILLPSIVKDHRSFLKEFLLPVSEEVRLNAIFGSNDVQFLFTLQNLKDEVGFELGTKVSSCTRHVFESFMLIVLSISDSLKTVSKSV